MTVKDIIALANAGYTAEQIAQLEKLDKPASDPAPAQPAKDPAPAQPASDPTPAQPAKDPTPAQPTEDPVAAMLAKLNIAIEGLQAANIQKAEQPHALTAEEAIAQVINPPRKGGNK